MMPRRCTHFPGSECLTKGSLAAVSRLPDQLAAAATDAFPFFSPPSLPEQKGLQTTRWVWSVDWIKSGVLKQTGLLGPSIRAEDVVI